MGRKIFNVAAAISLIAAIVFAGFWWLGIGYHFELNSAKPVNLIYDSNPGLWIDSYRSDMSWLSWHILYWKLFLISMGIPIVWVWRQAKSASKTKSNAPQK